MKPDEEHLDVLQNLEFAIVEVFRANPAMTDYSALRAYEAARQHYRAEQRGQPLKPNSLTGLDAAAYEAVMAMCEFRLGRDPGPPPEENVPVTPITLETLTASLQKLAKSVERHTRHGGRQGYLTFIDQFLR